MDEYLSKAVGREIEASEESIRYCCWTCFWIFSYGVSSFFDGFL